MGKTHHEIGSTEMKVWHRSLTNDFTEEEYMNGIKAAQDHTQFMDLASFRQLCRLTVSHKSHKVFGIKKQENILSKEEMQRRISEMRKNLDI